MDCFISLKSLHPWRRVWIIFWTTLVAVEAIQWRIEPRDQVAFRGNTLTLTCSLPSLKVRGDVMHWMYSPEGETQQKFLSTSWVVSEDLPAERASRYIPQVAASEFQLTILDAVDTDSGYYACMIYHDNLSARRAISRPARLTVVPNALPEGSPTCSVTPSDPLPGEWVHFVCTSSMINSVSVLKWSKGNVEVPSTVSIRQDSLQKVATVTKILKGVDNHVEYACTESWPVVGSVTSQCRIAPLDVPINVTIAPRDVEIPLTEASKGITFTCIAEAYPPAEFYNWYFDGQQVSEYPNRFSVLEGGKKLRVSKLTFNSHRNFDRDPLEISCNARNSVGDVRTASAYLRIYKGRRKFGPDGGGTSEFDDGYQHPAVRLNQLLIALIVVSSLILCALIGMLFSCSRRRAAQSTIGSVEDSESSQVFEAVDMSSPLASIAPAVEYAKPLAEPARHSSYTPLCKDSMAKDTVVAEQAKVNKRRISEIDNRVVMSESIYENTTRFSLPELPGLPLSRLERRHKPFNTSRKENISM